MEYFSPHCQPGPSPFRIFGADKLARSLRFPYNLPSGHGQTEAGEEQILILEPSITDRVRQETFHTKKRVTRHTVLQYSKVSIVVLF